MAAWAAQAPAEFQPLKEEMRIMAPCKRNFNEGQPNGNYFDAYINQIWNQYANEDLVYKNSEGVTFRARVEGGVLVGKSHNFTVGKPTTQDAFEGKGELAKGEEPGRSVQAQLCAAINRGVAHKGEWYGDVSKYFTENPYNFYSKFIHENSYNGLAYSFCYSDVFNQEALIHHIKPLALVIDLKWD